MTFFFFFFFFFFLGGGGGGGGGGQNSKFSHPTTEVMAKYDRLSIRR